MELSVNSQSLTHEKNAVLAFAKYRDQGISADPYTVRCRMRDVSDEFPEELARYLSVTGEISRDMLCAVGEIAHEIIEKDECRRVSGLAVNGQDMMSLGLKGKAIGDTLSRLLDAVMQGTLENTRAALMNAAETRAV